MFYSFRKDSKRGGGVEGWRGGSKKFWSPVGDWREHSSLCPITSRHRTEASVETADPRQASTPASVPASRKERPPGPSDMALTGRTRGSETLLQKYCHGGALQERRWGQRLAKRRNMETLLFSPATQFQVMSPWSQRVHPQNSTGD